jgi:hypothetical protein
LPWRQVGRPEPIAAADEPGGKRRLRIEVDRDDAQPARGELRRDVAGDVRLADAALLVRHGDDYLRQLVRFYPT